jgi:hypothetical protein
LKRLPTEWVKIFASYTSDEGLMTRITRTHRELKKLNSPKFNDSMKKWTNELNRAFPMEVQMAKKHMKKCSTSLAVKEMQIKTIFTPVRMAIIKNTKQQQVLARM